MTTGKQLTCWRNTVVTFMAHCHTPAACVPVLMHCGTENMYVEHTLFVQVHVTCKGQYNSVHIFRLHYGWRMNTLLSCFNSQCCVCILAVTSKIRYAWMWDLCISDVDKALVIIVNNEVQDKHGGSLELLVRQTLTEPTEYRGCVCTSQEARASWRGWVP